MESQDSKLPPPPRYSSLLDEPSYGAPGYSPPTPQSIPAAPVVPLCQHCQSSNWIDKADTVGIVIIVLFMIALFPFGLFFLFCLPSKTIRTCANCHRSESEPDRSPHCRFAIGIIIIIMLYLMIIGYMMERKAKH